MPSTFSTSINQTTVIPATPTIISFNTPIGTVGAIVNIDPDLTAIAELSGTSGFVKKTAANTYILDTTTYAAANQSITLSGDATGSGTTTIPLTLATVPVAKGGTGATTAAAAITALTGTQIAGTYLRSDGTNAALATIQVADVPTLNQNTTGTAAGLSSALAIASGGTNATTASNARTNLGLAIGSNVQAWDADLDAIAALGYVSSSLIRKTAVNTYALDTNTYLTSVSGTTPVSALTVSGAVTVSMAAATSSANGYLTSTDWSTFNGKQSTLPAATASVNGYLTSTDWSTFNGKQATLSAATSSVSGYLTSTDWSTFNGKQSTLPAATASVNGYLTSTDWSTFNGKQATLSAATSSVSGYLTSTDWSTFNGKVASVSGTTPVSALTVSGAVTVSMAAATSSANGYLTSTDWNTFNNKQATLSAATTSVSGYLTSTDWNTFNNKQATLSAATSSVNGYLTSSDWTTFNTTRFRQSFLLGGM